MWSRDVVEGPMSDVMRTVPRSVRQWERYPTIVYRVQRQSTNKVVTKNCSHLFSPSDFSVRPAGAGD